MQTIVKRAKDWCHTPESEYTPELWRAKLLREADSQSERDDIDAMFDYIRAEAAAQAA